MGRFGLVWKRLYWALAMSQPEARVLGRRKNSLAPVTLRHVRNRGKRDYNESNGPHTFYVQALAAGSRDNGASLFLFSEFNRSLFNCGEGTQRLMYENKLKVSHLNTIFLTRINWANVGGLAGLLMSLRDIGLPSCVLVGPPQLDKLLQAIKSFCGPLDSLELKVHPFTDPVYKDEAMAVQKVPIFSNETGKESPPEPLDPGSSAETEGYQRKVNRGPPCVLSFVCKINDRKGHFLVTKAKEIGFPLGSQEIGFLVKELKAGRSVMFKGREFFPGDLLTPDSPGPTFLVVECPTEDFITPMTENETLKRYHEGNSDSGVALIVHMTPEHILNHSAYRQWMDRFGPQTEHMILNESVSSVHNQTAHKVRTQLNLIHPRIFPQLPELSRKEVAVSDIRGVKAECLLKYQLRPTLEWQRDMVTNISTLEFVKQAMELPDFPDALRECKMLLGSDLLQTEELNSQYPVFVFLGTGSAVPMKSRNVSCTLVHVSPSKVLMLDCGEGSFTQLYQHYGKETDNILCQLSAVFVSHIHADHHSGLPHVLYERERALRSCGKPFSPVFLVAPTLVMTWLNLFHDHCQAFLHNISVIPAHNLIEGAKGGCPKIRSLISSLLEMYQFEKFQTCFVRHCKMAFGCAVIHQSGWKLVFSGDTMPCEALIKMGKNATLLIHEATLEDGLEKDAIEKAHSTVSQAIGVGERMNAEYVMLNHFSQRYSRLPLMRNDLSRKVGISFDHMRVRWSDFQILPKLMEPIKALFAEDLIEMVQKKERRERIQKAQNLDDNLKPDPSKQDQEDDTIGPDPSKRHVEDDTGDAITKRMKVK